MTPPPGKIATVCRMKNAIPRGSWLEADDFRALVKEIAPLRLGGWVAASFGNSSCSSSRTWEATSSFSFAIVSLNRGSSTLRSSRSLSMASALV